MKQAVSMREPRPSLSHRLAWLFPPVGLLVLVLVLEGPKIFDFGNPENMWLGIAGGLYFLTYAAALTRDALKRRHL